MRRPTVFFPYYGVFNAKNGKINRKLEKSIVRCCKKSAFRIKCNRKRSPPLGVEKGRRRKRTDGEKRLGGEKEPPKKRTKKPQRKNRNEENRNREKRAEKAYKEKTTEKRGGRNETGATGVTKKAGRNGVQNGQPFAHNTE